MLSDQEDVMEMAFQKLVKLKKAVLEEPQDVLRTRIVSPQELLQEKELLGEAHHGRVEPTRGRKGSPAEDRREDPATAAEGAFHGGNRAE